MVGGGAALSMIPDSEYLERVKRVQEEMILRDIDLLVGYGSESEPHHVRYLSDFIPNFDFAGFIVPREGEAALITGGPESIVYAKATSRLKRIFIHPFFLETSAPPYHETEHIRFKDIIPEAAGGLGRIRRVGIVGSNIFPYAIYQDLKRAVGDAEIVEADDILFKVRMIKSPNELNVIRRAYRITEQCHREALDYAEPGRMEWEVEAKAKSVMAMLGAEGPAYPIWVCSGPRTNQGLSRSTDRKIGRGELVQLSIGVKYQGYCGNMCRPFVIGEVPGKARRLMEAGLEAENAVIDAMEPGVESIQVHRVFERILRKHGFGREFTLYGPAHGTGLQECEGPWINEESRFKLQPGMVFNVDIWLSDGELGLRWEDGVAVTEDGVEQLSTYRREIISK